MLNPRGPKPMAEDDADHGRRPNGHSRTVLVTGGAGYIGSALLPKLLAQGYRVRLLDMLLYGAEPIAAILDHPRLDLVHADFRQIDRVVAAMHGVDAVIHLGAIVGDPACALDEELTIEVNLEATRTIANVAKGFGVDRFVFASTCSVYGASDGILDESSELNPVSLYASCKIAAENVLRPMADQGFTPVVLRFGTVYGLSGRIRFDLVVNLLAAKGMIERKITVFGGSQWRPFVHVDDVARAIVMAFEAPRPVVHNHVFNVGSDEQNYTIQEVGEIVHRVIPSAELETSGSDTDRRNYRVSFEKIRTMLSFTPRWTIERGVQQVVEAIRRGAVRDYRDAAYSNVKSLSEARAANLIRSQNDWIQALLAKVPAGLAVTSAPDVGR